MSDEDVSMDEPTAYADTSAFTRLLAKPSRVKIIDVFLGKHYTDLTVNEIAHLAGIDPTTVHRNIEDVIDFALIEEAGTEGRAQRYRLNKESRIAQILGRARDELMGVSDQIPRTDKSEFRAATSGPSNIQESLQSWGFFRNEEPEDDGPKASDVIQVEGENASRRLKAQG